MKLVQIGVVAVLLAAAVAFAGVGRPGSPTALRRRRRTASPCTGTALGQLGAGPRELFVRRQHERRRRRRRRLCRERREGSRGDRRASRRGRREDRPADAGRDRLAALERRRAGLTASRRTARSRRRCARSRGRARSWTRPSQRARTSPPGPSFDRSDRDAALPQRAQGAPSPTRARRRRRSRARPAPASGRCCGSRSRAVRQSRCRCRPTAMDSRPDTGRARDAAGAGDGQRDVQPRVTGSPSCSHSLQEPG